MSTLMRMPPVCLASALALGFAIAPWELPARHHEEIELDEVEVFIEWNSTDQDFGIQFFWDGDAWKNMTVEGPQGKKVLKVKASSNVRKQGLTEGFFESAEPSIEELSMKEFLERFPAGTYGFEGRTLEGDELEGETEFTHILPAPPSNLSPSKVAVDASRPLVASFDAVTKDTNGRPLEPELYQVVIETENDILKVFSIILEGDVESPKVTVPPEFLEAKTAYKLEVIVQEDSGNRTIAETTFTTR